jgi:hypothetical protein
MLAPQTLLESGEVTAEELMQIFACWDGKISVCHQAGGGKRRRRRILGIAASFCVRIGSCNKSGSLAKLLSIKHLLEVEAFATAPSIYTHTLYRSASTDHLHFSI